MLLDAFHEIIGSHRTRASGNCETIVEFRDWDDPDNENALSSLWIFSDCIIVYETTARLGSGRSNIAYLTTELDRAVASMRNKNTSGRCLLLHRPDFVGVALPHVLWLNRRICALVLYYELARRGLQDIFAACARWLTSFDI